ncbi:MAG TPA: hypothetical protein VFY26_15865 [Anaerolineales bacterium]|nr:hypothetical protein [Anaerolineales bacterium]
MTSLNGKYDPAVVPVTTMGFAALLGCDGSTVGIDAAGYSSNIMPQSPRHRNKTASTIGATSGLSFYSSFELSS